MLWLLLAPPDIEDLWDLDHFFSNPAKIESFRRWRASFGDISELISTGAPDAPAAPLAFWAADKASKSSIRDSILYLATNFTSFQIQVRIT